ELCRVQVLEVPKSGRAMPQASLTSALQNNGPLLLVRKLAMGDYTEHGFGIEFRLGLKHSAIDRGEFFGVLLADDGENSRQVRMTQQIRFLVHALDFIPPVTCIGLCHSVAF